MQNITSFQMKFFERMLFLVVSCRSLDSGEPVRLGPDHNKHGGEDIASAIEGISCQLISPQAVHVFRKGGRRSFGGHASHDGWLIQLVGRLVSADQLTFFQTNPVQEI